MNKTTLIILFILGIVVLFVLIKVLFLRSKNTAITLDQARAIAEERIKAGSQDNSMSITKVEEKKDGWIFYYTTQKYLETIDSMDVAPGNNPLMVYKNGKSEHLISIK